MAKAFDLRCSTLALTLILSSAGTLAGLPATAQNETTPAVQPPVPPSYTFDELQIRCKAYRQGPNETTWQAFIESFKRFLSDPRYARAAAAQAIAQNPSLKDLNVRVIDAGGSRLWIFPNIAENRVLFIQSGYTSAESAPHIDTIDYPDSINISDARIVSSVTTTTQGVGRRKKVIKVQGPRFMVVTGNDRLTGLVWVKAFKPYNGSWVATTEPFAQIPQYLLENVSGRASFSGSNLILNLASSAANADEKATGNLTKPKSSAYQIVLKLVGSKYVLADGGQATSGPLPMIAYFVQCIRNGRLDLAKAWLDDPGLVSIPKYVGLVGAASRNERPYKLVAMATPPTGGPRFRLVTYKKTDLIFDTVKSKSQWMIKGIFIAPSDPLAQQLNGSTVGEAPATPPAQTAEPSPAAPR